MYLRDVSAKDRLQAFAASLSRDAVYIMVRVLPRVTKLLTSDNHDIQESRQEQGLEYTHVQDPPTQVASLTQGGNEVDDLLANGYVAYSSGAAIIVDMLCSKTATGLEWV